MNLSGDSEGFDRKSIFSESRRYETRWDVQLSKNSTGGAPPAEVCLRRGGDGQCRNLYHYLPAFWAYMIKNTMHQSRQGLDHHRSDYDQQEDHSASTINKKPKFERVITGLVRHVTNIVYIFNNRDTMDTQIFLTRNLGVWDTAGQEDYNRLRPLSYRGADVFILAFSLISKASFENVSKKWIPELKHYAPGVPLVLVGTMLDLRDDRQFCIDHPGAVPISNAQGEELRKLIDASAYVECSSKTQQNVKAVFDAAIREGCSSTSQAEVKEEQRTYALLNLVIR